MELYNIASALRATPKTLQVLLKDVEGAVLSRRPAEGEWCINEVVGHLIEADRQAFIFRIKGMLETERFELQPVDADAVAARRRDHERDLFDLIEELTQLRGEGTKLILELSPADLERTGVYPSHGEFRIADFVYEWVYHDYDHIQQILDNLKAHVWPNLGNIMQCALSGQK